MTLGEKQQRFARMVADLLVMVRALGYECALGEALRSNEQAIINGLGNGGRNRLALYLSQIEEFKELGKAVLDNTGSGIKNSLHELKLALDLLLFKDGVYLTATKDYEPLGLHWEALGGTWGGRFGDGNHFSLEHNGVR